MASSRAFIVAGKDADTLLNLLPDNHPLMLRLVRSRITYEDLRNATLRDHPGRSDAQSRVHWAVEEAVRNA